MDFKPVSKPSPQPGSPEELHGMLSAGPNATKSLWSHQADVLRAYHSDFLSAPDVAIELPTGTGKTLIGLLIAEWRRRTSQSPVVFACPTVQLVKQVQTFATREGFNVVALTGPHKDWDVKDEMAYASGTAVAISTYSSIFNSSPKLSNPDYILFDDAHAGEQYVAEAHSVYVRREEDPEFYKEVVSAFEGVVDPVFLRQMRGDILGADRSREVRGVPIAMHPQLEERLDAFFSKGPEHVRFAYSMIRNVLPTSLAYMAVGEIQVRPLVPPTHQNALFSNARQRVYLSATMGQAGEIQRAFGRARLEHVELPPAVRRPRSGRRFFLFPELADTNEAKQLARELVGAAGKALVLAPSQHEAEELSFELGQTGWPHFTIAQVRDGMEPFAQADHGTCGLANRYDGLDLPGTACRAVVISSLPNRSSLHERFLGERVRSGTALAERIRARVTQGIGRCTRGPGDTSLVIVLGSDLSTYLRTARNVELFDAELQAEINFGVANSEGTSPNDLKDMAEVFLAQSPDWIQSAEPAIESARSQAIVASPPWLAAQAASAQREVTAFDLAAGGDWSGAVRELESAAVELGRGGEPTKGYRALLLVIAAAFVERQARSGKQAVLTAKHNELVARASDAASGTWLKQLALRDDSVQIAGHTAADISAATTIAELATRKISKTARKKELDKVRRGLECTDHGVFERALSQLGKYLGADAFKPSGDGQCDSAWCFENYLWLTIEAKSEHTPSGSVPLNDVRQANSQLDLLGARRNTNAPVGSVSLIVSPRQQVSSEGLIAAKDHLYLVRPEVLREIADDTIALWDEVGAMPASLEREARLHLIRQAVERLALTSTALVERLTTNPLSGVGG